MCRLDLEEEEEGEQNQMKKSCLSHMSEGGASVRAPHRVGG